MPQAITLPPTRKWPPQGAWTYEDYLKLPDDGRRFEIIEGVLYVTNAPNFEHQFTVMEISHRIKLFVDENKLGIVLTAPFEVHLSDQTRPVFPDVLFIKSEHWPETGAGYFEGVPDLIVEVLSPSTRRTDQVVKFTTYEQAGVPEYWIVDPKSHSIQVFVLSGREYGLLGEFVGEDVVLSSVLAGLQIVAQTLFNPGR
ncbi:MAG TPA: Uma2 family endonuclease [Anaerolineales bacterium]|nr:Uma2 family endonuclease [Anaerolineales bacterium]